MPWPRSHETTKKSLSGVPCFRDDVFTAPTRLLTLAQFHPRLTDKTADLRRTCVRLRTRSGDIMPSYGRGSMKQLLCLLVALAIGGQTTPAFAQTTGIVGGIVTAS